MTVRLLALHWAANARIQRAANNNPPIRRGDPDRVAVKLLQEALITSGFRCRPVRMESSGRKRPMPS